MTLIQGDAQAEFEEHPIEVARRALRAAAEMEDFQVAHRLLVIASALPKRAPQPRPEFGEHPTEIARRALMAAADVEDGWVATECRRFAWALPKRASVSPSSATDEGVVDE